MIENFQQYKENDEDDENFHMFHSYWFKDLLIFSFVENENFKNEISLNNWLK